MNRIKDINSSLKMNKRTPKKVTITGAAGNIGYAISFMIGQGRLLGPDQPIDLCLLEIPQMEKAVQGVELELLDCAFPLIESVTATTDPEVGFKDCDIALLIGAKPRGPGMQRKDLLEANAKIFKTQAAQLDKLAKPDCKICVVGNPANTNACIIAENVKTIRKENVTALTRLDSNRALGLVAQKFNVPVKQVRNAIIWGNHSLTQYPDLQICEAQIKGKLVKVREQIHSDSWEQKDFIPRVQKRGAEIIDLRKLSSAASAANAVCDHIRNWVNGTAEGEIVSMAVWSDENSYNIPKGLIFSFPVTCKDGKWAIVNGLNIGDAFGQKMIQETLKELVEEKKTAMDVTSGQ